MINIVCVYIHIYSTVVFWEEYPNQGEARFFHPKHQNISNSQLRSSLLTCLLHYAREKERMQSLSVNLRWDTSGIGLTSNSLVIVKPWFKKLIRFPPQSPAWWRGGNQQSWYMWWVKGTIAYMFFVHHRFDMLDLPQTTKVHRPKLTAYSISISLISYKLWVWSLHGPTWVYLGSKVEAD